MVVLVALAVPVVSVAAVEGSGMPDGNPWGEEPWRQEELWQTGTEAHVTVVSRTEESDWVTLMLAVTNPSGVQLTITLGEQVRIITETEGITGVTFERLTPGTEYSFFVADPYGNVLASGTVTTSS